MLYCLTSKNWNSLESTLLGCGGLCASPHLTKGSSVPTAWSQCLCSGATCSVGISLAELQPILKWHGGTYWNLRTRFLSACNPSQRLHPTVLLFRACSSPRRARLPIVLLSPLYSSPGRPDAALHQQRRGHAPTVLPPSCCTSGKHRSSLDQLTDLAESTGRCALSFSRFC